MREGNFARSSLSLLAMRSAAGTTRKASKPLGTPRLPAAPAPCNLPEPRSLGQESFGRVPAKRICLLPAAHSNSRSTTSGGLAAHDVTPTSSPPRLRPSATQSPDTLSSLQPTPLSKCAVTYDDIMEKLSVEFGRAHQHTGVGSGKTRRLCQFTTAFVRANLSAMPAMQSLPPLLDTRGEAIAVTPSCPLLPPCDEDLRPEAGFQPDGLAWLACLQVLMPVTGLAACKLPHDALTATSGDRAGNVVEATHTAPAVLEAVGRSAQTKIRLVIAGREDRTFPQEHIRTMHSIRLE